MIGKAATVKRPLTEENSQHEVAVHGLSLTKRSALAAVDKEPSVVAKGRAPLAGAVTRSALADRTNTQAPPAAAAKATKQADTKRTTLAETKPAVAKQVQKPAKERTEVKKLFEMSELEQSWLDGQQNETLPDASSIAETSLCVEPMSVEKLAPVLPAYEDIDQANLHDPLQLPTYANEIFEYFREKELAERCNHQYLKAQPDLSELMRGMLVDWLITVHLDFRLLSETLYLCVNILDRYLSVCSARKVGIPRSKLQLVGLSAMLIAGKVEEIQGIGIEDFVTICNKAFTREQIIATESTILNALGFNLTVPTHLHFLRRFSKAAHADAVTHTLTKYLTELSLCSYGMLQFVPSMISASSMYLAKRMLSPTVPGAKLWTSTLEHYSKYREADLLPCARALNNLLRERAERKDVKAVTAKYCSSGLWQVAKVAPLESL